MRVWLWPLVGAGRDADGRGLPIFGRVAGELEPLGFGLEFDGMRAGRAGAAGISGRVRC